MTKSELDKYRKIAPAAISGLCILPWYLVRSSSLADAKLANDFIVPALAIVLAFLYVGLNIRKPWWNKENDANVRRQIRDGLIRLVPKDLALTEEERGRLDDEVFRELTGVFWEAIDGSDVLRAQKEFFYSNGVVYSTAIDVTLISSFFAVLYCLASAYFSEVRLFYAALVLFGVALISRVSIIPRARAQHMLLSHQQLELLERDRSAFVADRFRSIVTRWRRNRILS